MRGKLENNNDENYFFNSELGGVGKIPTTPPDDPGDDGYDDFDDMPDEACWMFDTISALMAMDKPFGFIFDIDKIEKFLEARGYTIGDKYFSHINDSLKVAIKGDPDTIQDSTDDARDYHIRHVFANEVQDIILKWLLKIGK